MGGGGGEWSGERSENEFSHTSEEIWCRTQQHSCVLVSRDLRKLSFKCGRLGTVAVDISSSPPFFFPSPPPSAAAAFCLIVSCYKYLQSFGATAPPLHSSSS